MIESFIYFFDAKIFTWNGLESASMSISALIQLEPTALKVAKLTMLLPIDFRLLTLREAF